MPFGPGLSFRVTTRSTCVAMLRQKPQPLMFSGCIVHRLPPSAIKSLSVLVASVGRALVIAKSRLTGKSQRPGSLLCSRLTMPSSQKEGGTFMNPLLVATAQVLSHTILSSWSRTPKGTSRSLCAACLLHWFQLPKKGR